jgi:geranylgeranyl reductase family protein
MLTFDAIVVGGGPAGSTCARALVRAGWRVAVVDRASFPRDKVCAGWLTPAVFDLLEFQPAAYRSAGLVLQDIQGFRTAVRGGPLREHHYDRVVSYAVRRCEFDAFLLGRANAVRFERTNVATLRRDDVWWVLNEQVRAPVIVGAGGHFCPVAQHLRGGRDVTAPVVAREMEFRREDGSRDGEMPMLFFCRDLEGYGWCVPKGDYINVGLGHRHRREFANEFRDFVRMLESMALIPPRVSGGHWHGHAYLASGAGWRPLISDGAVLIGDAAGLAYPSSGEGILPAVESGLLAARTLIAADGRFDRDRLEPYATEMQRRHPRAVPTSERIRWPRAILGRALLSSASLTRRVVLDRWFLHEAA